MKYKIYAIQDTMVGFHQPMIGMKDEVVIRDYKNWLAKNPNAADMRLFRIGTFEDETGTIEPETPTCICGGGINNGESVVSNTME